MSWKTFLFYDCNLEMLHLWIKDRDFRNEYCIKGEKKSDHPGRVLYMCDGRFMAGGLADRLHGIISLYMYCQERGRDFRVYFCDPFSLSVYLEPNEYNWQIDPDTVSHELTAATPVILPICAFVKGGHQKSSAFMKKYLDYLIGKKPTKEFHVYTNMHYAYTPEVYSKYFHILFKPSRALQEAVEWNKRRIGSDYVSVTLRFQNLLGDFYEGKFPTLPEAEQTRLMQAVRHKIESLHEERHPKEKFLITSDSRKFLDFVDELDFVYTIPGKLVHMSYTPIHDFETHLKSFVDLMMLADAQKLYLLVTGQMYKSGFAQSASFINNRPYEVINFDMKEE